MVPLLRDGRILRTRADLIPIVVVYEYEPCGEIRYDGHCFSSDSGLLLFTFSPTIPPSHNAFLATKV